MHNNNDNNEHSCICKSENTQKIDCCYTGASIPKTDCCHTGENILDTDFGYTLSLINGKYKLIIIYWLANHKSVMRYNFTNKDVKAMFDIMHSIYEKNFEYIAKNYADNYLSIDFIEMIGKMTGTKELIKIVNK